MSHYFKFFAIILFMAFLACNRSPKNVHIIDPDEITSFQNSELAGQDYRALKVAVSAILSPKETFESYEDIFRHISDELNIPIEFHQRKTYTEINQLLEAGQLDFAFICSGAYIDLDTAKGVELLAVPVSGGEPYYKAYIIVNENIKAESFEDLRNRSFAFTDPMSNTGYLYAKYRLHQMGAEYESFFSSVVFTYGHDTSIQMVAKGIVDAATVDHLVFEYLKAKTPERVQGIKIIEESKNFGIPPIVVSNRMDKELREKVLTLFLDMHNNKDARELINSLLIDKFIEGADDDYNSIREMKATVSQP